MSMQRKTTDARAVEYIRIYGDESWELDALEPDTLAGLVRDFVESERDEILWNESLAQEEKGRERLKEAAVWLAKKK
jgi:hypothetical protein